MAGRIQNFLDNVIKQGLSYNNEYTFTFLNSSNGKFKEALNREFSEKYSGIFQEIQSGDAYLNDALLDNSKLSVLCEEISLPGISTATGNAEGIYAGVNFKYAHTKTYNDLSISFLVDKDYRTMTFFQFWYNYIFEGQTNSLDTQQNYKLKYYDDYCLNMFITKGETKSSTRDRKQSIPVTYKLINAYPISISSVPLNTGASSVTRFSVTLAYERWVYQLNPGTSFSGDKQYITK